MARAVDSGLGQPGLVHIRVGSRCGATVRAWQAVDATPLTLDGPLNLLVRAVSMSALLAFVSAFISIEGFDADDVLARFRWRSRPPVPLSANGPYR